jgi:DNA modification methylase
LTATIHVGDSLAVLRTLPDASVQSCVTSPPYWNLRDYGVDGQIGLEASVDDWVRVLVAVFTEVRRVLRDDGTLWLNVGDAYVTHPPGNAAAKGARNERLANGRGDNPAVQRKKLHGRKYSTNPTRAGFGGLARKQRLGLPHRLVFALQAAGWWWRDEIVWGKRSPMPESTRDRSTQAHEFLFLLTKRARYFFDQDGWKEPVTGGAHMRVPRGWDTGSGSHRQKRGRYGPKSSNAGDAFGDIVTRRNRRSVWMLSSEPFRDAHFATFPTKLVDPCLRAGTSVDGCCPTCGAPRRRIVRKGAVDLAHQRACGSDANGEYHGQATKLFAAARAENAAEVKARILAGMRERVTVGWAATCRPTCAGGLPVPCTVLDPFAGSGTTGVVATARGCNFVGIDLSPEFAAIARRRIDKVAPLFVPPAVAGGGA